MSQNLEDSIVHRAGKHFKSLLPSCLLTITFPGNNHKETWQHQVVQDLFVDSMYAEAHDYGLVYGGASSDS